jgi:hypothetical protein
VERCRSKTILVPDDKRAFLFVLTDWMRTCVSPGRAAGLIYDNPSVDQLWKKVEGLSYYERAVTIYPDYEPLTFTQNGKTCYGVKSVELRTTPRRVVGGTPAPAAAPDPPPAPRPAPRVITEDMIKEAAAAGRRALAASPSARTDEVKRLIGVLGALERHGKAFDDRYFPVAPFLSIDALRNPAACFTEYSAGNYACLPQDAAVKACTRHLATDIVTSYHFDEVKDSRFAEILEIKANEIRRGFDYIYQMQQLASSGGGYCSALKTGIMPLMGQLAKTGQTTVYGFY